MIWRRLQPQKTPETLNYAQMALQAGCPLDQVQRFGRATVVLQSRQLAASAAARLCDAVDGPTALGYGGARGGGKSYWLLAQMGADDCQRFAGLKCLLLRKVGKANTENLEDLRRRLFVKLPHTFTAHKGILTFENGSRIIAGHFQNESDIDNYLGLEYDVIGIEEATTLSRRKYVDISTCSRSSKAGWRPRIYSTTNPGGVGHAWYKAMFIDGAQDGAGSKRSPAIFIPARVEDNQFNNPEYRDVLDSLTGWQKRAWREGDWDLAAGQYFTNFRRDVHVLGEVDELLAHEWFAALDYGFTHYTVCLLGFKDGDGNIFIVDEHAERQWLPHRHAAAISAMIARHRIVPGPRLPRFLPRSGPVGPRPLALADLRQFVTGADVFGRQWDGTTIAQQYAQVGIKLACANMDRVNGWAEILRRFGQDDAGPEGEAIQPSLFIHKRCARLIDCLPNLQHDPNRPEDVLKVDCDEDGLGGDDTADALRYLVNTHERRIIERRLTGL